MPLTWKDGAATGLLVLVALIFYAYLTGTSDIAIVADTRGALLVIGALGLGMCIVGSNAAYVGRSPYAIFQSVLGVSALAVIVIGLITAWAWTVTVLTLIVAAMWAATLVRHLSGTPVHGPTHA
jgi:peptidoglycan/LPS O-acetylase OafA/YrhL